jgi:hypothetical protein
MSLLQKLLGRDGTSQARISKGGQLHIAPRTYGLDDAAFLGAYGFSVTTGELAATLAANAVVGSFRWGDATKIAAITGLRTRFLPKVLFTAAQLTEATSFDAYIARGFTASHTGGTALTLTTNSFKRRTSFSSTAFTDLRVATTAALGGGTITDTAPHAFSQSIRKANRVNPAAATEEVIPPAADGLSIDFSAADGDHPIILVQNEGILIRNRIVWPAAGTGTLLIEMSWNEYATSTDY